MSREPHWEPGEWAYDRMKAASEGGRRPGWVEVSARFYWQAFEVLPPIFVGDGFMVSEAYDHDDKGRAIYAAFVKVGGDESLYSDSGRRYATYCTVADFPQWRDALSAALAPVRA